MPHTEVVVTRHEPCPWLPEGGFAEVVLAKEAVIPGPTAVARLLVTAGDAVLAVPRPDGRGLDIPTSAVTAGVEATLNSLVSSVLQESLVPGLLGFVRNTVNEPTDDYPWPAPVAHFVVWHCDTARTSARHGRWLGPDEAAEHLSERHWWPLVRHAAPTRRGGRGFSPGRA